MPKNKVVISSFSYSQDEIPLMDEVDKIAEREKRSRSFITIEALKEYVKNHKGGNSQYTIEKASQDGFIAFPSVTVPVEEVKLDGYSDTELETLANRSRELSKAAWAVLKRRDEDRKVHHHKIKESDIKWHMDSKKLSHEQAVAYLKEQGFEE